ncbi:hypothetical protein [Luteolibacter sp. AS25]|uniref:hypothetical protein n=1 Tax=Luteolibacter sp. AS25 TaxID=3135776 RepID=UPI00398B72AD
MNTLRMLLMLGMLSSYLSASEPELPGSSLFSHPGAFFHVSGPGWKGGGKVIENRQRQTKPTEGEWVFRSGLGKDEQGAGSQSIRWHFITSTEYGDIYVVTFEDNDHRITTVPIIYDGKKPMVLNHNKMRFEISGSATSTEGEQAATMGGDKPVNQFGVLRALRQCIYVRQRECIVSSSRSPFLAWFS